VSALARQAPFIGREPELETLVAHLATAGHGEGSVVLVAGEPGIGKTRLLAALAARASHAGWRVLTGNAYEPEAMAPYLPFAEALRGYLRAGSPEVLAAQLGAGTVDVAAVLPELPRYLGEHWATTVPDPVGGDAGIAADRYRVFEAVCDFLAAIAGGAAQDPRPPADEGVSGGRAPVQGRPTAPDPAPLLLILDDLQWADTSSLLLLQHLGRRLAGATAGPLLVVGAYRSVEVGRGHRLTTTLAALRREGVLDLLPLTALSAVECTALIAAASGQAPAPAVADALYRATAGSPLFLGELVRHPQSEGRDLADPDAALLDWRLPEGLRALIDARVGRLSEQAHRLLMAAAVLGDGVHFDVLAHVCGGEPLPLLDALDETLAAGLLRPDDGGEAYSVSHALIRQALAEELSLPRRHLLHRLAVEALEALYAAEPTPHLAALARHTRLAGPSLAGRALEYARRAGEAALAVYAWEEAAQHWQAALALGPLEAEQRFALLLQVGYAQGQAGQQAALQETVAAAAGLARKRGDARWLAQAAIASFTPYTFVVDIDPTRVQLLEEAAAALADEEPALRARVLAGLTSARYWSGEPARLDRLSAEALAQARRSGEATALAHALIARHYARGGPEHVRERRALSAELIRVAAGRPELQCIGRYQQMRDAIEVADWRRSMPSSPPWRGRWPSCAGR
jgi:predicted ATPase